MLRRTTLSIDSLSLDLMFLRRALRHALEGIEQDAPLDAFEFPEFNLTDEDIARINSHFLASKLIERDRMRRQILIATFLAAFSILESHLVDFAVGFLRSKGRDVSRSAFSKDCLSKLQSAVEEANLSNASILDDSIWGRLRSFKALRNILVHENGILSAERRDNILEVLGGRFPGVVFRSYGDDFAIWFEPELIFWLIEEFRSVGQNVSFLFQADLEPCSS